MNELQSITLLDLPNEILLKILTFLPLNYIKSVRQTCSRLYQISQCKEIWEKQHFLFYFSSEYKDEEEMLNWLIETNPPYLNLEINFHRTYVTEEVVLRIARLIRFLGPKIGSLQMYGIVEEVPFSMIEDIMLTCVSLKELKLSGLNYIIWPGVTRIKPDGTHTKLEILELSLNLCSSTFIIDTLLNFYPFIKTFIADYFFDPKYWNRVVEFNKFLVHKITTTNKLIENLKYVSIYNYKTRNRRMDFITLASSKLRLRSIHLGKEEVLSRADYKHLFSEQNNLREIYLKECKKFDAECLRYLVENCPKLEHLNISCYNNPKVSIADLGTNLKILELIDIVFSTESTIGVLFPNLERVVLNNCSGQNGANCYQFLENCRLRVLKLESCSSLRDTEIIRIVSASKDTLVDFGLFLLEKICDLEKISVVHLPKLEKLEINASKDVTQAILNDFNFPWLKFISISSYEIEEQCFKMMTISCPLLEDVYLEFDSKIDNRTLLLLSEGFYFLKSLFKIENYREMKLFSNRKYNN